MQPARRLPRWGLLVLGLFLCACGGTDEARRPNVILIVVDTLRADALERPEVSTPNLRELAQEGVMFTRALSHAPMTLPSHTALFSSRHPFESGVLTNHEPVPEDLPLLPEWMRKYGYETRGVISMATLWHPISRGGLSRGFDVYDMDPERIMDNADATEVNDAVRSSLAARNAEHPLFLFVHYCDPHDPYRTHGTSRVEARVQLDGEAVGTLSLSDSNEWRLQPELAAGDHTLTIEGDRGFYLRRLELFSRGQRIEPRDFDTPWFEVREEEHIDFAVPEDAAGPGEIRLWLSDQVVQNEAIRRYALEVQHVDRYVGELLDLLRDEGLYEDSLVIFLSDHGEGLGEHGTLGHVENLSDSLLRVPLIIKLPASHPKQEELLAQADNLVPLVDLAPTIIDVAGLPDLPGQVGASILRERNPLHVAETHTPEATRNLISMRDERYKLVYAADTDRFEMFDLLEDPQERRDVFAERGSLRAEWQDQLRAIAAMAEGGSSLDSLDDETRRVLNSLGYGGKQ